jgi:hypothetical protein
VSEIEPIDSGRARPPRNPNRLYILIAAVLVVVIIVAAVLLITQILPAGQGEQEPTAATTAVPTVTQVPTFTPGPTQEPTLTPVPPPPTMASTLVMTDTSTPTFDLESAGARPSFGWTGFFGQVADSAGTPLQGVWLIIWYRDGQPASPPVQTDQNGYYEIRLAEAPLAGTWTIQVLNDDGSPASKLFSFLTDENTETGVQQIQVNWRRVP